MATEDTIFAQRLECALCFELLQEPKQLICTHTFCQHCLAQLLQFHPSDDTLSCPICRKITELEDGDVSRLKTNIPLKSMIGDLESVKKMCTNCDPGEKSVAEAYCQHCVEYMCDSCLEVHAKWKKNANHKVVGIEESIIILSKAMKNVCRKHPKEEIELVCTSCNVSICFKCQVIHHRGSDHVVEEVNDFREKVKEQIESLQRRAEEKTTSIGRYLDHVEDQDRKVKEIIAGKIADITKAYKESVQKLHQRRSELIQECQQREEELRAQLEKIRADNDTILTSITSASQLIANGTKGVLAGQTLDIHSTLCDELERMLSRSSVEDVSVLTKLSDQAEAYEFQRCPEEKALHLGDLRRADAHATSSDAEMGNSEKLGSNGIVNTNSSSNWKLETVTRFALSERLDGIFPTPDGRLVVHYPAKEGFETITVDGQRDALLLGDNYASLHVLSDGRYISMDNHGDILLWAQDGQRFTTPFCMGMRFKDTFKPSVCVDDRDNIYVHSRNRNDKLGLLEVFNPEGGKPIREFKISAAVKTHIRHMHGSNQLLLLTMDDYHDGNRYVKTSILKLVDDGVGTVKQELNIRDELSAFAVLNDDYILVAHRSSRFLNVDLYTPQLEFVRSVLTDFKVIYSHFKADEYGNQEGYDFQVHLGEFAGGEIAFTDGRYLYVSPKRFV